MKFFFFSSHNPKYDQQGDLILLFPLLCVIIFLFITITFCISLFSFIYSLYNYYVCFLFTEFLLPSFVFIMISFHLNMFFLLEVICLVFFMFLLFFSPSAHHWYLMDTGFIVYILTSSPDGSQHNTNIFLMGASVSNGHRF